MSSKRKLSTIEDMIAEEQTPFEETVLCAPNTYAILQRTVAAHGARPGVSFQLTSGPQDHAVTLSWAEVLAQTTRLANALRRAGVGPEDAVAMVLPNCPETAITLLAGMTAARVAPINPLLEPEQIAALLREIGAKAVVTLKPFMKTDLSEKTAYAVRNAPACRLVIEVDLGGYIKGPKRWIARLLAPRRRHAGQARVVGWRKLLEAERGDALDFAYDGQPDDICAYFHSGGTTGAPKVAAHRQKGAIYNGWCVARTVLEEDSVLMCPLPLFHVFGAYPMFMSCLRAGAHFVLPTPAGYRGDGVIDNFWKLLERWRVNFFCTVPTALAALMQRPVDADVSSVHFAICGSAATPRELFLRFEKAAGVEIIEGYGQTEATCLISCNPTGGLRQIGSVGLRFPYTDLKIVQFTAEGEREAPAGEVGEICFKSPGAISGYLEEERNKALFTEEGFIRTGDLGRRSGDDFLWITGRSKDIIIRGGHNIDPAVVEDALAAHDAVAFVGAIGQPDSYAGEVPCAYVELVEGREAEAEALREFAAERCSERAARPVHVEIMEELPKTAVGKIFKPPLRAMAINRVFTTALEKAGIVASIEVVEDKSLGQVAEVDAPDHDDDALEHVLGDYAQPWRRKAAANQP